VVVVAPGGPAEKAGIKTGDVIVGFARSPVTSSDDLGKLIQARKPGATVTVDAVHRDGSKASVRVTLGVRPLPKA
jgi:S1-C subfamily serine protease